MAMVYEGYKRGIPLTHNTEAIYVDGYWGNWYVIDVKCFDNKSFYLLEHEIYGQDTACLIVDEAVNVILDNVWNGFDDLNK